MRIRELYAILSLTLCLSLLGMIPINRNYSKDSNVEWMSKVNDDTRLIDMSIPGTHDSGATHSIFDVAGKCQDLNIKQQLNVGTRFFDLRLQLVKEEFRIIHGPVDQNLKFRKVMNDLSSFIKKHSSEMIIISLKQEDSSKDNTRPFEVVLKETLDEYKNVMSFSNTLPTTLKEGRGKIHIISRCNLEYGYPAYEGWKDDTTFTLNDLYIQDNYCIDNIKEKKDDIISTIHLANSGTNDKLIINFTSCYLDNSFPPSYAGTTAKNINQNMISYLRQYSSFNTGIMVVDFMSKEFADSIIWRNY